MIKKSALIHLKKYVFLNPFELLDFRHTLFLIIITSIIETAVCSGICNVSASWLMTDFSSSSSTPSAKAISTAQAKAVSFNSSDSPSEEAFTKAPGPSFFRILNNLSNSLSKAGPEKLSYILKRRI